MKKNYESRKTMYVITTIIIILGIALFVQEYQNNIEQDRIRSDFEWHVNYCEKYSDISPDCE